MVRWSEVCRPKDLIGLGIQNLSIMNQALLCKWWWKICNTEGRLWQDSDKNIKEGNALLELNPYNGTHNFGKAC